MRQLYIFCMAISEVDSPTLIFATNHSQIPDARDITKDFMLYVIVFEFQPS